MHPRIQHGQVVVVSALLGSACLAPPSEEDGGNPSHLGPDGTCVATLVDEHYLETSAGRHLYVEPRFVDAAGDAILVAGTPTYAWTVEGGRQGEELRASEAAGTPFFGAVFDRSEARTIPLPPKAGPVRWVYGTELTDGRWGFVMEAAESSRSEAPHRAVLYAELGPAGWEAVEELGGPQEGSFLYGVASQPTRDGDDVVWSVVRSLHAQMSLATFRRTPSGWQGPDISDVSSNTVATLASRSGPTRFVVAGLDPATGYERSSLRLYPATTRSPGLSAEDADVVWTAGPDEQLHGLLAAETPKGTQVGWILRGGDRDGAWVVSLAPSASRQPTLVDAEASSLHVLGSRGDQAYWLTSAADETSGAARLRLHRTSANAAERIVDIPSPFTGLSSGTLSPSGEIVVVGPEAHFETTPPFVRSLVLRFSLLCDS